MLITPITPIIAVTKPLTLDNIPNKAVILEKELENEEDMLAIFVPLLPLP